MNNYQDIVNKNIGFFSNLFALNQDFLQKTFQNNVNVTNKLVDNTLAQNMTSYFTDMEAMRKEFKQVSDKTQEALRNQFNDNITSSMDYVKRYNELLVNFYQDSNYVTKAKDNKAA